MEFKRALINPIFALIQSTLTILFITNTAIWNSEFSKTIYTYTGMNFTTMIEIASSLYKGFRYGK